MIRHQILAAAVMMGLGAGFASAAAWPTRSESFGTLPTGTTFSSVGNSGNIINTWNARGIQDESYARDTYNQAGGGAAPNAELRAHFRRLNSANYSGANNDTTEVISHVGDTDLGGTLDLTKDLYATGKIRLNKDSATAPWNGDLSLGFFNISSTTAVNATISDFVGLRIGDPDTTPNNWRPFAGYQVGASSGSTYANRITGVVSDQADPNDGNKLINSQQMTFTITYDSATRQLQVKLEGSGLSSPSNTNTIILPTGATASFNEFGLYRPTMSAVNPETTANIFLDDLVYSVAVPEPASLSLLTGAGLLSLRRRRIA